MKFYETLWANESSYDFTECLVPVQPTTPDRFAAQSEFENLFEIQSSQENVTLQAAVIALMPTISHQTLLGRLSLFVYSFALTLLLFFTGDSI